MSRRSLVLFLVVVGAVFGFCIFLLVFGLVHHFKTSRSFAGVPLSLRGKPLPAKKSRHSGKEFGKALLAYNRRTTLDAYRKAGVRSPKWDAAAERVLEGYCLTVSDMPSAPPAEKLATQAKAVLDLGCTDPLLQYIYARQLQNQGWQEEAIPWFQRSVAGFTHSAYPKGRSYSAPLRLAWCYRNSSDQGLSRAAEMKQAGTLAIQWAADSLRDGSYLPGEERIQLEMILGNYDFFKWNGAEWIAKLDATPGVDPYVAKVLKGSHLVDAAWDARGSGFANTVTPEGGKGFNENLLQAKVVLEEAWKLHPDWPEAPSFMIIVANGGGAAGSPRLWFDRAVAAQFDYMHAYTNYISPLQPRWGGSHAAMYAFGKECLDTGRFDSEVPVQYYYLLYSIEHDRRQFIDQYQGKVREYWERPEVYPNLIKMCEGYATEGDTRSRDFYRMLQAMLAWEHKDYDAAKKAFDAVGNRVRPIRYLAGMHPGVEQVREEVYTKVKPVAALLAEADRLRREQGPAAARDEYRRILAKKWDPVTKGYIEQCLHDTERELQFRAGGWLNLLPAADMKAWHPVAGSWTLENGALTGVPDFAGLQIYLRGEYGARLEMTGDVEFLTVPELDDPKLPRPRLSMPYPAGFYAGAAGNVYNRQDRMQGDQPALWALDGSHLEYFVDPLAGQARIMNTGDNYPHISQCALPVPRRAALRLQLWDNEMTTWLNGKLVHKTIRVSPLTPDTKSTVGLGSATADNPYFSVRFNNLRLRMLTTRPATAGAGLATQPDLTGTQPPQDRPLPNYPPLPLGR